MRAYSDDLRQRIVRAVDQGHRQAEIAAAFQVSVATIKRYLKQRRETGHVTAKPIPGRPPTQRAALEAELPEQLAAHRDVTLAEHCRLFEAAHGQRVSRDTMRRAIDHLGWTWKKSYHVACTTSLRMKMALRRARPSLLGSAPSARRPFPLYCGR